MEEILKLIKLSVRATSDMYHNGKGNNGKSSWVTGIHYHSGLFLTEVITLLLPRKLKHKSLTTALCTLSEEQLDGLRRGRHRW